MSGDTSRNELETHRSSALGSDVLIYLAILVLAAMLRVGLADAQSVSMDEVWDIQTARQGWRAILDGDNRFPPLYHVLLWSWWQVFPGDVTGRLLSVVFGSLLVGVVGLLGRAVGGRATGWWSAIACALSPLANWYAVESRPYGLYLLLAAIAIWHPSSW